MLRQMVFGPGRLGPYGTAARPGEIAAIAKRLSTVTSQILGRSKVKRGTHPGGECFAAGNHYVKPEQAAPLNIVLHATGSPAK